MAAEPPKQGRLRRLWAWLGRLLGKLPEMDPGEQAGILISVTLGGIVIGLNVAVIAFYKPDLATLALIFDGDMTAALVIVAIVAVVFEFWKLRKPPEMPPIVVQVHPGEYRFAPKDDSR